MESVTPLPVSELAQHCAEEMERFRRRQDYDPRYCYELFRYALEQRDDEAWDALYSQYYRLVRHWLGDAPDDPDALANQVFERLWRAIPPDRFADFSTLDDVLAYLRRCAQCVALDARRREERRRVEETVPARTQGDVEQVLDKITGERLYGWALECLDSPQERLVFRASFEWDMRPGEIAERWPDVFASAQEVSRIKERILRRLQRDEAVRQLSADGGNDER